MKEISAIGDIHGNYFTFLELISKIPPNHTIICVGDLMDRGSYSYNVVEFIRRQNSIFNKDFNPSFPVILSVKGNHEVMFIEFYYLLKKYKTLTYKSSLFLQNGGLHTILTYLLEDKLTTINSGIINWDDLDHNRLSPHIEFLESLPLYISIPTLINAANGRYPIISHSAIFKVWKWSDPTKPNRQIGHFTKSILWGRPPNMKDTPGIFNIFGHTPKETSVVKEYFANIDTGAFYDQEKGKYNKLTALSFPSLIIIEQETLSKDKTFDYKELI